MILNKVYKSEGGINVPPIQKVNLRKGYYAIRWDFKSKDESTVEYMEYIFDHLPTEEEIREVINGYYNDITDKKILTGFVYEDVPIWLSLENQNNYLAAAILQNTSYIVKGGDDTDTKYLLLDSQSKIMDFVSAMQKFILDCIEEGRANKFSINYDKYKIF